MTGIQDMDMRQPPVDPRMARISDQDLRITPTPQGQLGMPVHPTMSVHGRDGFPTEL